MLKFIPNLLDYIISIQDDFTSTKSVQKFANATKSTPIFLANSFIDGQVRVVSFRREKQKSSILKIVLKNPEGAQYNIRFKQIQNSNQNDQLKQKSLQNIPKVNLKFQNTFSHIFNAAHQKNTKNIVNKDSIMPKQHQQRQEKHFYDEVNSLNALLIDKQKQLSQTRRNFQQYKLQTSFQIQKLNKKLKGFQQSFQLVSPNRNQTKLLKAIPQNNIEANESIVMIEQMKKERQAFNKKNKQMLILIGTIKEQLSQKNKLINHLTTIVSILTNEKAILKNDKRQLQREFEFNNIAVKQLKDEIFKFNSQIKRRQRFFDRERIKYQNQQQKLKEQLLKYKEKYGQREAEIVLYTENQQRQLFQKEQKKQTFNEKNLH